MILVTDSSLSECFRNHLNVVPFSMQLSYEKNTYFGKWLEDFLNAHFLSLIVTSAFRMLYQDILTSVVNLVLFSQ
jgi:hypothetical protein